MSEAGDENTIPVGETSAGTAAADEPGQRVRLPVVELLTGRGLVTGKSGSGKSNTASVIAENLLDAGHPLMIVDTDGEYYGLKEEYELLHVGADEECDIQVTPDHAGKLADLALADGVPIILDVSGYLHEDDASELLTAVARQLFAKGKKLKRPFLLLVEEIHEYVPEGGGIDECGRMLVKVGKRGRKHGLGIAGISQRPADVKKDFITQCDWLCWHRLTWRNDTRVVKRVLGSEYAEAVESLDDGETFLVTDWAERIRRVQFDRKRTFDAGATPGLEDFERPELKSVDTDLVGELEEISEAERRREDRIAQLEAELAAKEERIEDLESRLEEARDLSRMAEQFVAALDGPVAARDDRRTDGDGNGVDATGGTVADETGGYPGMKPLAGDGNGTLAPPEPRRPVEREMRRALADLDERSRAMLAQYRERGPCEPVDAHVAAGGDADRTAAYRRNRQLREAGVVRHAGRGRYAYALAGEVRQAHDGRLAEPELRAVVERIERVAFPDEIDPQPADD
jgi:hypothetical protein